ncbi:CHAT domain-containing protein, partial [bacterium]|nr:CHAT domain-containing protein [bacterium]
LKYYLKAAETPAARQTTGGARAAYYAGLLLSRAGDFQQADQLYLSALGNPDLQVEDPGFAAGIYQAYAKNLNQQQMISQALEQIEQGLILIQQVPESTRAPLLSSLIDTKATIQLNDRRYREAETTIGDYLQTAGRDAETVALLILKARAQLGQQNASEALATLEQASALQGSGSFNEERFSVLSLKSDALTLKQDLNGAVENQKILISLIEQSDQKQKLGPANLKLAGYYIKMGRLSDAYTANGQARLWVAAGSDNQLRLLLNSAGISREQGQIDQSLETFTRLQALITPSSPPELVAEAAYQRGYTRIQASRLEEALMDFKQSEKLYQQLARHDAVIMSRKAQATVLIDLGDVAGAEAIYLALLDEVDIALDLKGDINNALAFLYLETGQYAKALSFSQAAETVWEKTEQRRRIPEALNTRGLIFLRMNDFDQAEVAFQQAIRLNEPFQNSLLESDIRNNLGGLYKSSGRLEKARQQLLLTAELQKKLGLESMTALTSNNIGSVLLEQQKFDEALSFFRQSRAVAGKYRLKKELAVSWSNEGSLFFKQEKFAEAEKAFHEAIQPQQELGLNIDLASSYNNLSIIAAREKKLAQALELVQKSVVLLSLKPPAGEGTFPNPELNSVLAPNLMKDFLQNKGNILHELADQPGNETGRVAYLAGSYQSLALAAELIESLRAGIKAEESQKRLMQNNIEVFQQLITILFKLGNESPGKGYHETAFYYAEMSRARSFLDKLQAQTARAALKLPPEIREREQRLKDRIASLDQEIFVELKKPQGEQDRARIEQRQLQKTEVTLEYSRFNSELEKTFPAYADLKFPRVYDVKTTQQELLTPETLLMSYFIGDESSYGWVVGPSTFAMVALPAQVEIDRLVRQYRKTLVNPLISPDEEDEELIIDSTRSHIAVGLQIQRNILLPLLKVAGPEVNQLIVIPDGVLYYLPFETVLTQIHFQTGTRFPKGREYLLHRYAIRYTPSVSVLGRIQMQVKNRDLKLTASRKTFVGFGDPEYKPAGPVAKAFHYNPTLKQQGFYELSRLINTKRELDEISAVFDGSGSIYLRENARESTVKGNVAGYRYIHFATHGILDELHPEFSGVVMNLVQPDTPEDGFLQASEIFDLSINADLVVLSACETGLGKVIKGEGMVGLTRAFLFAGTSSIVVSLWTVADESTSRLMIHFYKYLKEGDSKDDALRKARLDLMNEMDGTELAYSDPFYWGPFILNGTRI